jgi:hypothetical protein
VTISISIDYMTRMRDEERCTEVVNRCADSWDLGYMDALRLLGGLSIEGYGGVEDSDERSG